MHSFHRLITSPGPFICFPNSNHANYPFRLRPSFAIPGRSSYVGRVRPVTASSSNLQIGLARLVPVIEESEEDMDVFKAVFPTPVRRHKQVRMRTKSVRHSHAPPGLDHGGESAIELESPVLQVVQAPPTVMPPPYSVTRVVGPLPEHEFDLELGVIGEAFGNGKGVEYECGEWLPGIELESQ